MKKFALPLLLGLVLSVFAFTGCDGETLLAPENTWCWIKKDVAGQDLTFYMYYTASQKTITYKTDNKLVLEPGLTVVVSKDIDLIEDVLETSAWTYKTFPLDTEVKLDEVDDTDDKETKNSFKFKATYWDAIYLNYYKESFKTHQSTTTPKVITKGTNVTSLQDVAGSASGNLTWKKVVKSLLSNYLDD